MTALKILEVKGFMGQLLFHEMFDSFYLSELEIHTANIYKINGRLNKSWFDDDERERVGAREYAYWKDLRPFAYQIIKGSKTPRMMKLVFLLSAGNTRKLVEQSGVPVKPEEVGGLFLNLHYESGALRLITGTSTKTFTMDKSLENQWDLSIKRFLGKHGFAAEEE